MKQIGQRAYIPAELANEFVALLYGFTDLRVMSNAIRNVGEIHAEYRHDLTGAVMKVARDASPLIVLGLQ